MKTLGETVGLLLLKSDTENWSCLPEEPLTKRLFVSDLPSRTTQSHGATQRCLFLLVNSPGAIFYGTRPESIPL